MKAWKALILIASIAVFSVSVLGQGFGTADLTVEESLTEFVTNILGFPVESAADALIYFLGPVIAFYLLISNFAQEGYNNFQKRLEQRPYYEPDEDLPVGMKLFSLITSFITVVTIGQFSASLILLLSTIALFLALLMFLQLINFDNDGNNGGGGQTQQQTQQNQNQGQQQQKQNQGAQHNQGPNWSNIGSAFNNLLQSGQNIYQGWQQAQQQSMSNQLEESLRYFQNDMISEIELVRSNQSKIENLINDLEHELTDTNDFDPDTFKNTLQRAQNIDKMLEELRDKMVSDFNQSNGNPSFNGSKLETLNSNYSGRNIKKEIRGLEGQLERIMKGAPVNPPDDKFNDLLDLLKFVVALGHFIHRSPFSISEIANNSSKAKKVVDTAEQMNKINSRPDNVSELQMLAGWLENRKNMPGDLIDEAERLCRKEMKINEKELEAIKELVGEDESIHNKLKYIKRNLSKYQGLPSGFQDNIDEAASEISQVDSMLASLENNVSSNQEHSSQLYKKLKELEGAI